MLSHATLAYARLEILRGLRNRSYIFFSLAFPVAIYLMNTGLGPGPSWTAEGLPAQVQFMVSMTAFGVIMTALSVGPRIAREREVGWLRQLRVTPIGTGEVVAAKVGVGMCLALPVILLVFLAATLVNGVALTPLRWLSMTVLLWLGAAPFVAIGIAVGYLFDTDSANIVNSGALLVLAFLGGLFVPMEALPGVAQGIGRTLPSYRYADLAWSVAASGRFAAWSALSLGLWTLVLGALALLSFRRAAVTP